MTIMAKHHEIRKILKKNTQTQSTRSRRGRELKTEVITNNPINRVIVMLEYGNVKIKNETDYELNTRDANIQMT